MAERDALVLIFSRNAFYKRLHYLVLGALGLCLVVICILISLLMHLFKNPTHPLYFASDNVSRLLQIVPVSNPNMPISEVIIWSIDAVQSAYSYDFINYRSQLQMAQRYFTNYGWTNYMKALRASNNLVGLADRQMVSNAQVIGKPKVLAEGILGGAYAWKLQMPVLVTYSLPPYDEKSKFSDALVVTVLVQRQAELDGYKGLGVVQMIASLLSSPSDQTQDIGDNPAS
jgi:intracellular multiplication protein IcmL